MALYSGYSTFEYQDKKTLSITDISLVKLDLLNHIFTSYGERVMMPNFGSIIPEVVFEPLDEDTVTTIEEELTDIFNFDPRVELLELVPIINTDENLVEMHVKLFFVEFDIVDNMDLNILFEGS